MNHRILDASVFLVRGKREGVERTSVLHVAWVSLGTGSLSEVSLEVSLKCVIEIFFQPISCTPPVDHLDLEWDTREVA